MRDVYDAYYACDLCLFTICTICTICAICAILRQYMYMCIITRTHDFADVEASAFMCQPA